MTTPLVKSTTDELIEEIDAYMLGDGSYDADKLLDMARTELYGLRELEMDAARYQWLRDQDQFHGDTFSALNEWLWANGDFSDITAAIDAEISEPPQ